MIGGFAGGSLVAAAGSVWASEGAGGERVHRYDPDSGKIVASVNVTRNPTGLAYGAGALWVAASGKAEKLGGVLLGVSGLAVHRIDAATNKVVASVPIPMPDSPFNAFVSASLEFVGDALWICDSASGTVVRVDPATDRVVATITPPPSESGDMRRHVYSIHVAEDRAVLRRYGYRDARIEPDTLSADVTVWQIDPDANRLSAEPARLVRDGVVLGFANGAVWLGNRQADGLTRVDPKTLQPLSEPLMIGGPVYAIEGGGGSPLALVGAGPRAMLSPSDPPRSWVLRFVP
jgi:sugar lactone lactonase YvrE